MLQLRLTTLKEIKVTFRRLSSVISASKRPLGVQQFMTVARHAFAFADVGATTTGFRRGSKARSFYDYMYCLYALRPDFPAVGRTART